MLLENILRGNEAFPQGRVSAGRLPSPIALLTCADARLNDFLGPALGITREDIVLIRNAGNVVIDSSGDPLRSLAMAIYLKGATEIAVLGHTDCRMSQFEANDFLDAIAAWGVDRRQLGPVDLRRWAGAFHDPRQNVKRSVELIAQCPFIPKRMPVHGLIMDIQSGRIEVLVDGGRDQARRETPAAGAPAVAPAAPAGAAVAESPAGLPAGAEKTATKPAAPPTIPSASPAPTPASVPINIPGKVAAGKEADSIARPIPKDLLASIRVLRQAYAEVKSSKEYRTEAEMIRDKVFRGEDLLGALDRIERHLRRLSAERPDVIAALRILREHAERSPAGGHVQKLLQQVL